MWQRNCTIAKILPKLKGKNPTIPAAGVVYVAEKVHSCKNYPKTQGEKTQIFQKQWLSNVYVAEKVHNGQTESGSADCHSLGEH